MLNNLYLYKTVHNTTVLGPGNRFCIWVQGCNKQCYQCIAPDSHSKTTRGYELSIEELAETIISIKNIDGITISGGEPFLQSSQIYKLIILLKKRKSSLNYIVYSGFKYQQLIKKVEYKKVLDCIDLLIDGEYIDKLNKDTPLIGSSNQSIYILSDVGKKLAEGILNKKSREVEILIKSVEDVFIIGIPPKSSIKKIKQI